MDEHKTIAILPDEHGQRLDKVLTNRLAPLSRSQVKKLIESGRVSRNGKATTVHAFVANGDTIVIASSDAVVADLPEIPVLAETDDYVVIDKPAGVLVHRASAMSNEPTLADWINKRYPTTTPVGDPDRPGIMHRLDRYTSGVMVIAKTPAMFDHLKKQFQNREVKKTYLALVHGKVRNDDGEINLPIARSRRNGRMAVRPALTDKNEGNEEERIAITKYEVIKRFRKPFTLLHAYPLTGRTHQIRAHLLALSHPVVGDMLYTAKRQPAKIKLGRHFLHAESLTFTDLGGNVITNSAPMPAALKTYLDSLV